MNKYKIIGSLLFTETIEADSIDVMETGQICFYRIEKDERKLGGTGVFLVAVFPAGCAVIKVEDEDLTPKEERKLSGQYGGGVSEVISIPAGNANTVINTDYDWKSPDKKKKKVK